MYLCLWQALLIPEISQVELAVRSNGVMLDTVVQLFQLNQQVM